MINPNLSSVPLSRNENLGNDYKLNDIQLNILNSNDTQKEQLLNEKNS